VTHTLPKILLTRPEAQSRALASRLRGRVGDQVPILISPILEIVPVPFEVPLEPRLLVLTSAHAADAAARVATLAGLPAYCVGDRTAEAARAAGFEAVSAGGSAGDLLALMVEKGVRGPVLHVRGRHAASDLEKELISAGIDTHSVIAYDQTQCPLSSEAIAALAGNVPLVLPVYSPRSSYLLAAECVRVSPLLEIVAISRNAADPWSGTDATVSIVAAPDGRSMEDAIVERVRARTAC
jgi:uroporphyrinogen-III synthase